MVDSEEQKRLQELYDAVYDQARVWFQNLKVRFHNQILQHFGPMPEREADIQVIQLTRPIRLQVWICLNLFCSKKEYSEMTHYTAAYELFGQTRLFNNTNMSMKGCSEIEDGHENIRMRIL